MVQWAPQHHHIITYAHTAQSYGPFMELCRALLCLCSCIYCKNQADRVLFVFWGWWLVPSIETKVGQRWPCFPSGVHKSLEGGAGGSTNAHKGQPQKENEHTLPPAIPGNRYVDINTATFTQHLSNKSFALFVDLCCTDTGFHEHDMNPN